MADKKKTSDDAVDEKDEQVQGDEITEATEDKDANEASSTEANETKNTTTDDEPETNKKPSIIDKIKGLPKKQKIIYGGIVGLVLLFLVAWMVPSTKYAILNTISEADASLTVVDSTTEQPVSGALVTLADGSTATTDAEGVAFFNDAAYGPTSITITKEAYETVTADVTIKKDNEVLGEFSFVSTGIAVPVSVIDWLTEEPLAEFVISPEDSEDVTTAVDGVATLNVPLDSNGQDSFVIRAEGYNDKLFTLDISKASSGVVPAPDTIEAVRSGQHSFLSNRDGTVGFYTSNLDGTSAEKKVATDEDGTYLNYLSIPGELNNYVVLLQSEEFSNQQDKLAFVDVNAGSIEIVDDAIGEDVDFSLNTVDEERVIYEVSYLDGRDQDRKVKSFDFATKQLTTIVVRSGWDYTSYNPETNIVVFRTTENGSTKLFRTQLPDGEREIIHKSPENFVCSFYSGQTDAPNTFAYQICSGNLKRGWYQMAYDGQKPGEYLGTDWPEFDEPDEVPDSEKGLASPTGTNRVWVETRDSKGRLILNESSNVINTSGSLSVFSVIRWIDDTTLTVTGTDGVETADYIVDIDSGNYKKITNTFRQSYYRGF